MDSYLNQPGQVANHEDNDVNLDQESGKAVGSYGATLNGSNSGHGQHTDNIGVVREGRKGKRSAANTGGTNCGQSKKRTRTENWTDDEKNCLLVSKLMVFVSRMLQYIDHSEEELSKSWTNYVSDELQKDINSCRGQWDSLIKSRNIILEHESAISSGRSNHVSFWQMTDNQKNIVNQDRRKTNRPELPRMFPKKWNDLIQTINRIKDINQKYRACSKKKMKSIQMNANHPSSSAPTTSTLITDSTILAGAQGSQQAEDEILGMSSDDPPILRNIPALVRKHIEDVLKPLISDFQGRREDEQKHRDKMLAIEEKNLDLMRENMHSRAQFNGSMNFLEVAGSTRSQAGVANVQHYATYQMPPSRVIHNQLSNIVNADVCNIHHGAQAGVGGDLSFQTSSACVQYGNPHDPLSGMIHQLPNANAAGPCGFYSAQAGTAPNANVQSPLPASFGYQGQQYTIACDPYSGVIHQPNASPSLCNIYIDGQAGNVGAQAGVTERSLVHAGQYPIPRMQAPIQNQDSSDIFQCWNTV